MAGLLRTCGALIYEAAVGAGQDVKLKGFII